MMPPVISMYGSLMKIFPARHAENQADVYGNDEQENCADCEVCQLAAKFGAVQVDEQRDVKVIFSGVNLAVEHQTVVFAERGKLIFHALKIRKTATNSVSSVTSTIADRLC